ncbi:RNase adapter RapZ [Candidatus Dependentiae bacterium]|nr:RNase adapter RapZ [Candidatus Dependentiae bacterium]
MHNSENNIKTLFPKQAFIITGLSGAGKTVFIRSLEDFGFYCVDNLPLPLLSKFLNLAYQGQDNLSKVALSVDVRGKKFLPHFIDQLDNIKKEEKERWQLKVVFLNASKQTLTRRFQETRRNHPLSQGNLSLISAIEKEIKILDPIKCMADIVLDTDIFTVHDLRKWVKNSLSKNVQQDILVNLISFGFKFGVPVESNLVCDLRFLPNPFFEEHLKKLDGRNPLIRDFLFKKDSVIEYWDKLRNFLNYSIQKFYQEGRFFVNVSVGCTGGKHRSVAFVEKIASEVWDNTSFLVQHRDLGKE